MDLKVDKNRIDNPEIALKRAGFAYIYSWHTGQGSFVKRLTRDHYPRVHLYAEDHGDFYILSLHVDQKKVSYKGSHAHNADYEGPVVEAEISRLQELFGGVVVGKYEVHNIKHETQKAQQGVDKMVNVSEIPSAEEKLGQGSLNDIKRKNKPKKKNWFKKIFNI